MSAKQLSLYPDEFEPVVFEKQSDVGGLWIYTDSTTVDKHGLPVHSSVYKYLRYFLNAKNNFLDFLLSLFNIEIHSLFASCRLNFPKELEAGPDYPVFGGDDSDGSFVDHTQMLQYLRNYTEHFNLRQYIKVFLVELSNQYLNKSTIVHCYLVQHKCGACESLNWNAMAFGDSWFEYQW